MKITSIVTASAVLFAGQSMAQNNSTESANSTNSTDTLETTEDLFPRPKYIIPPAKAHIRRSEQAGMPCWNEGQWNCMTHSFQRCASGLWSVEQAMSAGTKCSPAGYTDMIAIEYDYSNGGQGGWESSGAENGQFTTTAMGSGGSGRLSMGALFLALNGLIWGVL